VVTNQAEIDAATLLRNEELQRRTLLESAAVSTLIAGVPDTMIHHIDQDDANGTWLLLARLYGMAGPAAIYADFLHAVSWRIPDQGDPATSIAELEGIFNRLASSQAPIPDAIKSMILLKSAPDGNGALSQSLLANCQSIADLTWDIVRNALQSQWSQHLHSATRVKMSNRQWNQKGKKPFQPGSQGQANPGGNQQKQQRPPNQGSQKPAPAPGSNQPAKDGEGAKSQRCRGGRKNKASTNSAEANGSEEYQASSAIAFASLAIATPAQPLASQIG
jgi:hypothetical protein